MGEERGGRWFRTHCFGLVMFLFLSGATQPAFSQVSVNETDEDVFDIFMSGIKIFQHNASHPMVFVGMGRTTFTDSEGNTRRDDITTARVPLTYSAFYSEDVPLDLDLYSDYYTYIRLRIWEDEQHAMVIEVTDTGPNIDRLWLRFAADPDETVYGGGEQFTYFGLRGHNFPLWVSNQGIGRNKSLLTTFYANAAVDGAGGDYYTTSFAQYGTVWNSLPVGLRQLSSLKTFQVDLNSSVSAAPGVNVAFLRPTFISSRGYHFHYDGPDFTALDFRYPEFHEVYTQFGTSPVGGRWLLQNGSDTTALLVHLTRYLGRQPPIPGWVYSGAILGVQGGKSMMEGRLLQAEESNMAVTAVWLQDWTGTVTTSSGPAPLWDWRVDESLYPDLSTTIRGLVSRGIRVLGSVNPFLNKDGQLYSVAEERGYLLQNVTNQTYLLHVRGLSCGIVDLTYPAAYNWYKNDVIKKNMIELGFSGWMADFGEYLPVHGASLFSGQPAEDVHNTWPVLWAKLNRQAVEEASKLGEIVFWTRAGFSGIANQTTLLSAGDQNVDWSLSDGLASTVTAALSAGMSGVALTHFDIGGFTTFAAFNPPLVRTEELLLRSAEMAVFTPVFRTNEGSQPAANVQFYSSVGTLQKFARLSRMFASMKNYTNRVVRAASARGLPAQRPLFLNYPDDSPSYDLPYQYMYGDDLLVAPVYLPRVTMWTVYLPSDPEAHWVFLWDESIVHAGGGRLSVAAPLGQPPVFYRNVSAFVDLFRRVASEPLVDLPAYNPASGSGSGDPGPGEVPPCRSGVVPVQPHNAWVMFVLAAASMLYSVM